MPASIIALEKRGSIPSIPKIHSLLVNPLLRNIELLPSFSNIILRWYCFWVVVYRKQNSLASKFILSLIFKDTIFYCPCAHIREYIASLFLTKLFQKIFVCLSSYFEINQWFLPDNPKRKKMLKPHIFRIASAFFHTDHIICYF